MSRIGQFVRREGSGKKWHVVESEIRTRVVTKCGREMEKKTKKGELEFAKKASYAGLCEQCNVHLVRG